MCGICGFVSKRNISLSDLINMNNTMKHRGPDDHGEEIYPLHNGYLLGLAHRRLSIVDLSMLAHQPMHSNCGRVVVIYNGEIYNFQEIKKELKEYSFVSKCDTEVIIAAYLKWGIDCINRFNGMFSIALYDRDEAALYLVRDRMGKKPLYYWYDGENIVFSSELKPIIMSAGFNKELDESVIGPFLYHQYIKSPKTIFKNVSKVEPGQYMKYCNGVLSSENYWKNGNTSKKLNCVAKLSYDEAKYDLENLIRDSVSKRMVADVPVGLFLSGGFDSTLVSALAQQESDKKIMTFSIGFNDSKYNEAIYAKAIANIIGTEHNELYIDESDFESMLDDILYYYDEPFADSSQIATMAVSKLARNQVTVVLSGDGGDELFCGYNSYGSIEKVKKYYNLGGPISVIIKFLNLRTKIQKMNILPDAADILLFDRDKKYATQYDSNYYRRVVSDFTVDKSGVGFSFDETVYKERNWVLRKMLLDQNTYLPDDIMCKVDRASMKYSLECRCPLLDYRVVEFANAIPMEYKFYEGNKKRILKDIVYKYVPRELMDRPKVGFAIPVEKWLKGSLKDELLDYSSPDFLKQQGLFEPEKTYSFIRNFVNNTEPDYLRHVETERIVWSYYMFQKWFQHYM